MSKLIISGGNGNNHSNLVIKLDLKPVHALQVRRDSNAPVLPPGAPHRVDSRL